ncbi:hypothetical protein MWU59_08335 [Flavobacteriaceae bacterium F08102]|nr:hypothetical protein [Flavobacteriaceae bacterium F08102]
MIIRYWQKGKKQKGISLGIGFVFLVVLFIFRDEYQPILLFIRKYLFVLFVIFIGLFVGMRRFRKTAATGKRIFLLFLMIVFVGVIYLIGWQFKMYDYMQTYNVYKHLNRVELNDLPLTQNERIQPLRNIFSMANESVGETKDVSLPHLVRVDGENKWTMAIQPTEKYIWQQISENTEEVFAVSSTTPFPRFSSENRIATTFSIGESMKFSRNTYNAVVQRFSLWQLFTMEPGDVFYVKNDRQQWVQVVSLIKWEGFFFPYPTFGGVMVIEGGAHDFGDYVERILIGKGSYISPDVIENYPYLRGQNILSEKVSRKQAESLKFIGGFSDPLPWNMETAVKIPDLPDDQNQQPFVTDFNFSGMGVSAYSGLYHWFGLEPVGDERTSLTFSVFIPADGTNTMYYYNHGAKKDGYAGVSAMPLKVIESRKEFDWTVNKPVEFRPYIKEIAGRKRMFFLGTISAIRDDSQKFDGAATPDLALIDSEYRDVVWIDAKRPSQWDKMVYDQLNEAWRASEKIGNYYEEKINPKELQQNLDSVMEIKADDNTELIRKLQRQLDSLKKPEGE